MTRGSTTKSRKRLKGIVFAALCLAIVALAILYLRANHVAVLDPKGVIAQKERSLIMFAAALSLLVIIPVFALTFGIVWKYRASNTKAAYSPELDHNRWAETTWWAIPSVIILILSVVTWRSTHELDPYKALSTSKKPLTIQVVALDWKWLFIYPDQHIATINYVQFPQDTPVDFAITSDAPMNSFWIPQLGGQIYAMSGMTTHLHLMADKAGSYRGSSANISGEGFSGMRFTAKATSLVAFNAWVQTSKESSERLDLATYNALKQPSKDNQPAYYALADKDLYNQVIMKYMAPGTQGMDMGTMDTHHTEAQ